MVTYYGKNNPRDRLRFALKLRHVRSKLPTLAELKLRAEEE